MANGLLFEFFNSSVLMCGALGGMLKVNVFVCKLISHFLCCLIPCLLQPEDFNDAVKTATT